MEQALQALQNAQGFTSEQIRLLGEMLQERDVKQRPGQGGKKLKYVSGDYAIATANRIFGFGKWGYRVLAKSHEVLGDKEYYTADIELYVLGCPFPYPGEGVGIVVSGNIEGHEKARKEAVTDALKRALRHFGDQFGLNLYNEDNYIEADGGSVKQVKDAGKATTAGSPRRVVDAQPATSAVPTPSKLRSRCEAVCGHGTWDAMVKRVFRAEIVPADDDLTPEDCGKIAAYLDRAEAMKKAS